MLAKQINIINPHLTDEELNEIIKNHVKSLPYFNCFETNQINISYECDSGVDIFVKNISLLT